MKIAKFITDMFKRINDVINQRVYVSVGDELCCPVWGPTWTKAVVTDVSVCGMNFKYKFVRCKNADATGGDLYTGSVNFLGDIFVHCNKY